MDVTHSPHAKPSGDACMPVHIRRCSMKAEATIGRHRKIAGA